MRRVRIKFGFTLLETLLALTIIASMMGLLAAIMGQADSWTSQGAEDGALLRLQRVGEAMRSQWADRRTSVVLEEDSSAAVTSPDRLSFTTATPLLFPEWPLVVATYIIEPDGSGGWDDGVRWRLVYQEARVSGMDSPPGEYALDVEGRSMFDSRVLLEGCRELAWERFGRATWMERELEDEDEEGSDDGAREDDAAAPLAARGEARPGAVGIENDRELRWRAFDETVDRVAPAVRLVGEYEGERFGWVFVVRALR